MRAILHGSRVTLNSETENEMQQLKYLSQVITPIESNVLHAIIGGKFLSVTFNLWSVKMERSPSNAAKT